MMQQFVITGTDTNVGKTVFAAMLMLALDGAYWKPIQSGIEEVDAKIIQNLTGAPRTRCWPETYILTNPLSPHRAAELDNVKIDPERIKVPRVGMPLIIEGAGGLMVPYTRKNLQINHFKKWNIPVILCARTGLGTINHTLLSLEALWSRKIPVRGLVFIGDENEDNMQTIAQFSGVKILGRLPILPELNARTLREAFRQNFKLEDFE